MIIIGHKHVPFKPFYWVKIKNDIKETPSNSIILFKQSNINFLGLSEYCKKNKISFANEVSSINEALVANANGASFLVISNKTLAREIQDIAENYLFDAKVLVRIVKESEMKDIAKLGIDGVLFSKGEI